jgi:thiol-disulfide isomerase/thioredoxin
MCGKQKRSVVDILLISGIVSLLLHASCISIPNQHNGLPPGIWRGLIFIEEHSDIIVTKGKSKIVTRDVDFEAKSKFIPFNFIIEYDSLKKPIMYVVNGPDKIRFNDMTVGRDIRTGNDTFQIKLHPYDATLKGLYEEDKMKGYFIVHDKADYYMSFEAKFGLDHRFNKFQQPSQVNVTGNYQAIFSDTSVKKFDAIGEFNQLNQIVNGTFRTETGDFGYLSGEITNDKLLLSCFDGAHAFLFEARAFGDSLEGIFYSGKHYKTNWKAVKVTNSHLRNPDSLTSFKAQDKGFLFSFSTPENKLLDFNSDEYKNKVKIVQILGSWCPNCRDESTFLVEYLKTNSHPDLVIVGLAFERYTDRLKAYERITKYKSSLTINYDIAYGGKANKDSASAALPQLTEIISFPTMIFVDRNNQIYKIHTGFDGPATSRYEDFKHDFRKTVQYLIDKK